jgi:hypothetical protein
MKGHKWVVRIVLHRKDPCLNSQDERIMDTPFIECLRYAGLLSVQRDDETGMCIDLHCPARGAVRDTQVWAQKNAERISSFGLNAVAAPEFSDASTR